ncbi:hypothetical protein BKA67DRAFT_566887 [Truncatella angustata]|uniref:Secreted protein n=1 Tax=Truncatella angustata TaxID=152316 RepID=A0A9P8UI74_9PEZI|nr:uncharacterized protein BKA67DRAFT_566887 [Truncatella angustata]KAH6652559.1 hypothetical protein BKA67DRAFT_566887 [Truncatella angustata]
MADVSVKGSGVLLPLLMSFFLAVCLRIDHLQNVYIVIVRCNFQLRRCVAHAGMLICIKPSSFGNVRRSYPKAPFGRDNTEYKRMQPQSSISCPHLEA